MVKHYVFVRDNSYNHTFKPIHVHIFEEQENQKHNQLYLSVKEINIIQSSTNIMDYN